MTLQQDIQAACEILKQGGLIVMPTETVYGLAADATAPLAVQKIYEVKGRPPHNPLIIHCADVQQVSEFAIITPLARQLFQHFSPGPLTLVLPLKDNTSIAKHAVAGLKTVAVRIPAHNFANRLLQALPFPLAAPSANISGYLSPTQAIHCETLGVPVFDGGESQHGLESTIIDASSDTGTGTLLRQGSISTEEVEKIAPLTTARPTVKPKSPTPKAPGQLLKHYAPHLPLATDITHPKAGDAYIAFGECSHESFANLSPAGDLTEAAHNLFAALRAADESGADRIAIAPIPKHGIGAAIAERLQMAKK